MITKRVEAVLVERYGHKALDKRRVMAEILRRFDGWEKLSDLPKGTAVAAEKLIKAVNKAFGDAGDVDTAQQQHAADGATRRR